MKAVYAHAEVGTEEEAVATALQQALQNLGIPLQLDWGHTLYHPEDLPFALAELPEVFTRFRQQVEAKATVRDPLPIPSLPPLPPGLDPGPLPTLAELGLSLPPPDPRARFVYTGGSTAAQARLQTYIWELDRLRVYKETRNGMLDPNDSSRLSAWLALGCLSPAPCMPKSSATSRSGCATNPPTGWCSSCCGGITFASSWPSTGPSCFALRDPGDPHPLAAGLGPLSGLVSR